MSGLTPSLLAALATIEKGGHVTPSELAARERIQRPTATKLISKLEADGLVARVKDPGDLRSSLITVTEAGSALLEETRTRKDAFLAARLQALTPQERATLGDAAALLERLLEEPAV